MSGGQDYRTGGGGSGYGGGGRDEYVHIIHISSLPSSSPQCPGSPCPLLLTHSTH